MRLLWPDFGKGFPISATGITPLARPGVPINTTSSNGFVQAIPAFIEEDIRW